MQLLNLTVGKQRRAVDDLLFKEIEILIGLMLLAGDDLIAAAEITQLMAKRDMHIQRQGALWVTATAASNSAAPNCGENSSAVGYEV